MEAKFYEFSEFKESDKSLNSGQFKDPVSHMCLAATVVTSWSQTQEMSGLSPFTVTTNILSLNSAKLKISLAAGEMVKFRLH